jgi:upstream-binding transcription factor
MYHELSDRKKMKYSELAEKEKEAYQEKMKKFMYVSNINQNYF